MTIANKEAQSGILAKLEASSFSFYLTGSRFFGNNTEVSDYDFFTDASTEGVRAHIQGLGFRLIPKNTGSYPYVDANTVEVWRYQKETIQVDVQLVKDVFSKNAVQELAKRVGWRPPTQKYLAKDWWTTAMFWFVNGKRTGNKLAFNHMEKP